MATNSTRIGLGRGKGIGYKNLVPMDKYVHQLAGKGVKTYSTFPTILSAKINFEKLGYDIARGKKGTGWMAVSDLDIAELKEKMSKATIDEKDEILDEYVKGWEETEQFRYEVGDKLPKIKNDDDVEEYLERLGDFEDGYLTYLREKINLS